MQIQASQNNTVQPQQQTSDSNSHDQSITAIPVKPFEALKTPVQNDQISLKDIKSIEPSVIKIQQAYREYRKNLDAVMPERFKGTLEEARTHVIQTAKGQIGQHYWSNFKTIDWCVCDGENVTLPFNKFEKNGFQSYFQHPYAHTDMENTILLRELVQNWPAPEKRFVIQDLKKCFKRVAEKNNLSYPDARFSEVDISIDMKILQNGFKDNVYKFTPNPMTAFSCSNSDLIVHIPHS